jgi:hypothetical protein
MAPCYIFKLLSFITDFSFTNSMVVPKPSCSRPSPESFSPTKGILSCARPKLLIDHSYSFSVNTRSFESLTSLLSVGFKISSFFVVLKFIELLYFD